MSMVEASPRAGAVANMVAPGQSVLVDMATRFGMQPQAFEATIRATVMKPDKNGRVPTREEFAAFLLVAKEHGLNPLTKEIYAFPDKGGIVPVVGVDGWARIMNSHPAFDGIAFQDRVDDKGHVTAVTAIIHRKDRSHPIEVTEYLAECRRDTDPWRKWPRRMLRHKAMIQAARIAFGFAGIYDEDEAERIAGDVARDVTPTRPTRATATLDAIEARTPIRDTTKAPEAEAGREDAPHDPETGEIMDQAAGAQPAQESGAAAGTAASAAPQDAGSAAPPPEQQLPASDLPIVDTAREKASQGMARLNAWMKTISEADEEALADIRSELFQAAKAADIARKG